MVFSHIIFFLQKILEEVLRVNSILTCCPPALSRRLPGNDAHASRNTYNELKHHAPQRGQVRDGNYRGKDTDGHDL